MMQLLAIIVGVFVFAGCARSPIKPGEKSLRRLQSAVEFFDDGELNEFKRALDLHIEYWQRAAVHEHQIFGLVYSSQDFVEAFIKLSQQIAKEQIWNESIYRAIRETFDVFEVYGGKKWGEVLVTGYFQPVLRANRARTAGFEAPLYRMPPSDLFGGQKWPPRASIELALSGLGLELAYLHPVDLFSLHIQGSGVLQFEDGVQLQVGYAGDNGWDYYPIGRSLLSVIEKDKMTWQAIEEHLRSLSLLELKQVLDLNPRYIFFGSRASGPITSLGTPALSERTLAVDSDYYPTKGALAFFEFEDPLLQRKTARFVFDQDRGGGVKGASHVDLFMGSGSQAKLKAGAMRQRGRLLYLLPKKTPPENEPSSHQ